MGNPKMFEIGQWVHLTEGIGQILLVRAIHVEKYTTEYYEGRKLGEYIILKKRLKRRACLWTLKAQGCTPPELARISL